jgi:hypothetical protein
LKKRKADELKNEKETDMNSKIKTKPIFVEMSKL